MQGILEGRLAEPVEVTASRLAPYGPRAVGYATRRVAEVAPDVVLVSVSAFACTVGLVYARVGERFGDRAQRMYQSLEGRYSGLIAPHVDGPSPDAFLRTVARKVIGTSTLAPVEEVGGAYGRILHELAQDERLQVIVIGESFFSRNLQHTNPGMSAKIEQLRAIVRPAAETHRFPWVDVEAAFQAGGNREQFFLRDGVHNSAAGHQSVAEVVAAGVLELHAAPGEKITLAPR